mgnify:CR=1 FL=1
MNLGNNERRMLKAMLSEPKATWTLDQILSVTGWDDQVHVAGAGKGLQEAGLLEVGESTSRLVALGSEGKRLQRVDFLNQDSGIGSETRATIRGILVL